MSDSAPKMAPYSRHIFICTGQFCDPDRTAQVLYDSLPQLLGDLADYRNPARVKRGTSPCLGVCAGGPILVVYPDGIWYHHVDRALLVRIINEHLINDSPVIEAVFHHLEDE